MIIYVIVIMFIIICLYFWTLELEIKIFIYKNNITDKRIIGLLNKFIKVYNFTYSGLFKRQYTNETKYYISGEEYTIMPPYNQSVTFTYDKSESMRNLYNEIIDEFNGSEKDDIRYIMDRYI